MDKYKIPKVERVGKTIFLTRKFESPVKLNIDVKVRSDLCPEQVAHSGTTCQVQLIAFNGGKAINTIEKLVQITKYNLGDSSPRNLHFSGPRIYVKAVYLVVCVFKYMNCPKLGYLPKILTFFYHFHAYRLFYFLPTKTTTKTDFRL